MSDKVTDGSFDVVLNARFRSLDEPDLAIRPVALGARTLVLIEFEVGPVNEPLALEVSVDATGFNRPSELVDMLELVIDALRKMEEEATE